MSQIAPQPQREAVEIADRGNLTKAVRARIIAEQGGVCAWVGCAEPATEIDHILPLWLGGADDRANAEALCGPHHARKTAREAAQRAHVYRVKAGHEGTKPPPTQPLRGRKFRRRWEGRV